MSDLELAQKIRSIVDRYVDDQLSDKKLHELKDVPSGIHGELADLLFIDKVENELFVNLILSLLIYKERTDEDIMTLLKDLRGALSSVIQGIEHYNKSK